jgi:hypothetical protein
MLSRWVLIAALTMAFTANSDCLAAKKKKKRIPADDVTASESLDSRGLQPTTSYGSRTTVRRATAGGVSTRSMSLPTLTTGSSATSTGAGTAPPTVSLSPTPAPGGGAPTGAAPVSLGGKGNQNRSTILTGTVR